MTYDFIKRYGDFQNLISTRLVGFEKIAECLLIALMVKGHVLLEGPPGVAKTMLAKTFASLVDAKFKRIQFTPDLLPTDILGTVIYDPSSKKFSTRLGPIFTNILLADEINRASPKTQAALLEAMEESQVTIEGTTYPLDEPFMVIATQNPIEQEGTYPLPEAQLDRFLFKIDVNYPSEQDEVKVLHTKFSADSRRKIPHIFTKSECINLNDQLERIFASERIMSFASAITNSLRKNPSISWGPSPRASISCINVGKALALLSEREYVVPGDITRYINWILNHRIGLGPEYALEGVTNAEIVKKNIEGVDTI
ncbi:MAG: AAA family ATPase [Candidatus Aenigmarchaeota archaeon]|nr:AAA family ATPase [Candidatus Aenigmarchaeota archaeon]